MKALFLIMLVAAVLPAQAQEQAVPASPPAGPIPQVRLNYGAVELQRALYPVHYGASSARADLRWAQEHNAGLESFWAAQGDSILSLLAALSGIAWTESAFDLFVLRYFLSTGAPEPLIIPTGGIRRGEAIEAAPAGKVMKLNVIYQLARRLLDQASESAGHSGLADHPLLRPGPYRRDILALVLAGAAAEGVLGRDSAQGAIRSAFWRNHFPGIEIYESYFAGGDWALSPQDPLVTRVLAEPPTSALMAATNPAPRPESTGKRTSVEGLPLSGELGMAISVADNGLLRVDALDPQRAAYASGLREGDLIRTVDGRRVKNHRELVEQILKTMTRRGATLQLVREGGAKAVVVRPVTAAERPGNGDAD